MDRGPAGLRQACRGRHAARRHFLTELPGPDVARSQYTKSTADVSPIDRANRAAPSPSKEGQHCGTLLPRLGCKCNRQGLLANAKAKVARAVRSGWPS